MASINTFDEMRLNKEREYEAKLKEKGIVAEGTVLESNMEEKKEEKKEVKWYNELEYLVEQYCREDFNYRKSKEKNKKTLGSRCDRYYKKIYDFVKSQRQVKQQELDRAREEGKKEIAREWLVSIKQQTTFAEESLSKKFKLTTK